MALGLGHVARRSPVEQAIDEAHNRESAALRAANAVPPRRRLTPYEMIAKSARLLPESLAKIARGFVDARLRPERKCPRPRIRGSRVRVGRRPVGRTRSRRGPPREDSDPPLAPCRHGRRANVSRPRADRLELVERIALVLLNEPTLSASSVRASLRALKTDGRPPEGRRGRKKRLPHAPCGVDGADGGA